MANGMGELTVENVNHSYGTGKIKVPVLFDINIHIAKGSLSRCAGLQDRENRHSSTCWRD